jgi:hypothetical protein
MFERVNVPVALIVVVAVAVALAVLLSDAFAGPDAMHLAPAPWGSHEALALI